MAYKISGDCVGCDNCRPQCPTNAIGVDNGQFWINPALCNNCEGYFPEPQCVVQCPTNSSVPYQAKKGRSKNLDLRPPTSSDLFLNGKNNPFASAIIIWEACNLLAQRASLPWEEQEDGQLSYERPVYQGRGLVTLRLADRPATQTPKSVAGKRAIADETPPEPSTLDSLDIRAACMHLIYAAYATTLEKPWEQEFVISDRQIEDYLGLDKRKDLSKPAKLTLIKDLAQQACLIKTVINWPQQGRVQDFMLEKSLLWQLVELQHHFQTDELGCKHLVGLTFRIRVGPWAKHFLNKQGCKDQTAFYQYGSLPRSLLTTVMSIWQQHEGATRMILWLLFKTRLGKGQRITIPTLMRIAYGEERLAHVAHLREERKRLIRTFESDLSVLDHYGLKPVFDPDTYPLEIQPLWAKLAEVPDDAEAALEFWMNDGSSDQRLTDAGPRGKWNLLMNARILSFELPPDWEQSPADADRKKRRALRDRRRGTRSHGSSQAQRHQAKLTLSGEQIVAARKQQGWSQRELAERTGKSQSWIRDIENGRFRLKAADQTLLRKVLNLG